MKKKLKSLLGNKQALEAFDILQQITVIDEPQITFNLIFNGWKYEAKQNSNYERHINTWKQAVIENTFGGDEVAFNYEMKRIAFILKNPGSISKVMTQKHSDKAITGASVSASMQPILCFGTASPSRISILRWLNTHFTV